MIIGVWGDSIAYGSCDEEALGWVGRLRKSLPSTDSVHVYNFGVCGEHTNRLKRRFPVELERVMPEYVIFNIGLNDSKQFVASNEPKVCIEDFTANLDDLFTKAKEAAERVVVISTTPIDVEKISTEKYTFSQGRVEQYNSILKEKAEQYGFQFVDVTAVFDVQYNLVDGLHPNGAGYQKLFEKISEELMLERLV